MEQENELGVKPVKKLLWKLAVPAITAQIVNVLYNVVDRIYIGHIPEVGKLALTGVGVCMPLIMLISMRLCYVLPIRLSFPVWERRKPLWTFCVPVVWIG